MVTKEIVSISKMKVKQHFTGKARWDAEFTNSRWGGKRTYPM